MSQQDEKGVAPSLRRTFLERAGESDDSQPPPSGDGWGFPSVVYSARKLCDGAVARDADSAGYLEVLQQSRTFCSPDCTEAMAGMLGASNLLRGLRGSLMRQAPSEDSVAALRSHVRQRMRSAWSQEVVRRGVDHAKAGEFEQALACYAQALDLDEQNTDALVARGAALANTHDFQRASDDLETALRLQPQHQNAAAYLAAVQQKAAEQGIDLPQPRGEASSFASAPAARGAAAGVRNQQRQQGSPFSGPDHADPHSLQRPAIQPPQRASHQPSLSGLAEGDRLHVQQQRQQQHHHVHHTGDATLPHLPPHPREQHARGRNRSGGASPRSLPRRSRSRGRSRSSSEAPTSSSTSSSSNSGEDGEIRAAAAAAGQPAEGDVPQAGSRRAGGTGMGLDRALAILKKHYKHSRNVARALASHPPYHSAPLSTSSHWLCTHRHTGLTAAHAVPSTWLRYSIVPCAYECIVCPYWPS